MIKPVDKEVLRGLDLFSGIGGITRGLSKWVRPIAYCEIEDYSRFILLSRMSDGQLPIAPIWDDVTTLTGACLPSEIDIIYGGFPCQDISVAGRGEGLAGKRSGLFFEICRLVKEIKPSFVFLENVPAIRTRGLSEVVRSLVEMGYDCRWTCITAASVGAPHKRERWFLLAHTDGGRLEKYGMQQSALPYGSSASESGDKQKKADDEGALCVDELAKSSNWQIEPSVGRVANGVSFRMDRIKALGNSVVPQQVEKAFEMLIGLS